MSDRFARMIFWVGTLSSLVLFLGLTVDTTRRWLTSCGVVGMSLAFGVAGVLQTYLERVQKPAPPVGAVVQAI